MQASIRPFKRQFYKGNVPFLILGVVSTLLFTCSNLAISWLMQRAIDLASGQDVGFSFKQLLWIALGTLALTAFSYFLSYVSRPRFIAKGIAQYKNYAYEQLSKKGIAAFSDENTSTYLSALLGDAASIEKNYLENVFQFADGLCFCVGSLVLMFWYNATLTLIAVGLSLLPLISSIVFGGAMAKAEKELSDKNAEYTDTLKDSLVGFSLVKAFRAEVQICRLFAKKIKAAQRADERSRKAAIFVEFLANSASFIVQIGVFFIGAYLVLSGTGMTAGTIILFVQLLNYVVGPLASLPMALGQLKSAKALIQKLANALAENVQEDSDKQPCTHEKELRVENLQFAYESEKPVLRGVSFAFEKGKSYAVVGASGSGKSTLLNLLLAANKSYQGGIFYDGVELSQISEQSLYDTVGHIQQNVFVFNATVRENVTMFSEFPQDEVERAIQLSGLKQLVQERGEDYLCGENGCGLSGGEKQRLSIARALLKKSELLLVDEATAALDKQTASLVLDAILSVPNVTKIVVTHALDKGALERFDCILTMKNGQIVEQGKFEDLLEQKGYFYSLFTVSQ